MRIDMACFTAHGEQVAGKLSRYLSHNNETVLVTRVGGTGPSLAEWTAAAFARSDALVFIGATGIAVRAIASHVVHKATDPAVIVMDELGHHVIPLLSGHLGGANRLARRLAEMLGAEAIITTATDKHGRFAVDEWALHNSLTVHNPPRIKAVSSAILAGIDVRFYSAYPWSGKLPEGLVETHDRKQADIVVDTTRVCNDHALVLVPRILVLGLGCRKGTAADDIDRAVDAFLQAHALWHSALYAVGSIDLKHDEPGIVSYCQKRDITFECFSRNDLNSLPGSYTRSNFVESVTGVDTVCERSAVAASHGGTLLIGKTVCNGVALAAAVRPFSLIFETVEAA